tara:strand:- start:5033 stop:5920 length:888 start_codon:yes stop_codon:yes gene_type:complete
MKYYIQLWSMVIIGLLICGIMWLACEPHTAKAHHDRIYTPCDTTTGHVHMSYEEMVARISIMEQDGTIPPGMISRYVEARDGGKGNDDPRFVWARNLEEGQILSLGNWASGHHPELEQLVLNSGLVAEWQLDANKTVRRFNDPYWMQANPLSPAFTVWESLCMANLGYSIPMFEVDDNGEWVSNVPTVTTTTPPPTTTIIVEEITFDGGTSINITDPDVVPVILAPVYEEPSFSWVERWFQAEWDDFPFEDTIKLLEERYPPNTPKKYHFRLSTAVEFLREGGKLKGLDNVWNGE